MLNFSKFQKTAEDGKTVTMRHEKGHEMRILLKALTPIEREQIKRIKMAKGGGPADATDQPLDFEPVGPAVTEGQIPVETSPAPAQPNIQPQGQMPQTPPAAQAAPPEVSPDPPRVDPSVLNSEGTLDPGAAAQAAQEAINLQSAIDSKAAQAKAKFDQDYITERQRLAKQDATNLQELKSHTDEFSSFIKSNPINPNLYGESQDSLQKTSTGIGLFLGGLGGQGKSNMALDYLNKNIDRSIEAQKENVANRKTVWGAYHDLYGNEQVANNLAKISANDILTHQVEMTAAQLGTAQAQQKAMQLKAQKAIENSKLLQDSVFDLKNAPGNKLGSSQLPHGDQTASTTPTSGHGSDHVLTSDAQKKYDQLRYDHTKTPQQIAAIQDQYQAAVQADKSIDQIKSLWPELRSKASVSGFISNKIDPHTAAAVTGAIAGGATALTGAGLPLSGGAAAAGAGVGEAGAHLVKGGLNALSGQQGTQYQTAVDSLVTQVGNALGGGITPTEKAEIAKNFIPTWWDSEETANNKLEKLIKKIKAVSKTSALTDAKMTSD